MHYTYDNDAFSDLYKDAYSVRPHGEDPEDLVHRLRLPYSEYGVEITDAMEEVA